MFNRVVIVIIIILFAWVGYILYKNQEKLLTSEKKDDTTFVKEADVVVTMDEEGFNPSGIDIEVGQTVKWQNDGDTRYWPASNLHPTHEIYSEFDPHKPIGKGESWSFTFKEVGEWEYHNHLNPSTEGVVRVK
ncbi:MAG: cupredoxin domain-containing protein [Parcubacteria group bacterium]|nr:cupredoxin domain-containing protein [Parcubacteria group bacterium]